MQSLDSKNDPHDVLEIAPDVVLVARPAADFPSLSPDAVGQHFDRPPDMAQGYAAAPAVDTTFRASVNDGVRSSPRWMKSASAAFLLALAGAFATAAWERYGDQAQAMVADLTPQIIPDLGSWLPTQRQATATPVDAPVQQAAVADQAVAPAAQAADNAAPAATATVPQDSAQMMQSMARDVASLTQQLGELKASIAQLKAAQEQLSHDMASRVAEARPAEPRAEPRAAEPRPKQLGAPPRSLGTLVQHKPKPVAYPPTQAAAVPPPPLPPAAAPAPLPSAAPAPTDGDVVVRPPMPLR